MNSSETWMGKVPVFSETSKDDDDNGQIWSDSYSLKLADGGTGPSDCIAVLIPSIPSMGMIPVSPTFLLQ